MTIRNPHVKSKTENDFPKVQIKAGKLEKKYYITLPTRSEKSQVPLVQMCILQSVNYFVVKIIFFEPPWLPWEKKKDPFYSHLTFWSFYLSSTRLCCVILILVWTKPHTHTHPHNYCATQHSNNDIIIFPFFWRAVPLLCIRSLFLSQIESFTFSCPCCLWSGLIFRIFRIWAQQQRTQRQKRGKQALCI
jgi:hypothetical protein